MSRKISMIKGVPALRRGLCFVLSLCLVFGAFVFAPGGIEVEAEAETNLKYGESYTLSITVDVTDDADGWNSAKCKVYTRPTNGLGRQHLYKEYDIKGSVDEGGDSWNLNENLGNEFVSEVELVTLDGNGRFLIPKRYLRMADITQDIKFIGMGDTIEIWSNQKVEQQQMKPEEFGQALQMLMEENSDE